jgi:hypothetical protein
MEGQLSPLVPPIFGTPVRANSDATQNGQHEPSLAVSRVHTNTVVIASKDYRDGNVKHVWINTSTDGGATWPLNRQLLMPGINLSTYPIQSDPVVMARDDGRIYVACLATNDSTSNGAFYITWTDDDGATWVNPSIRISPADNFLDDKDWFAIDNNPASPFYHRMYMMYAPGAGYVAEQHSTDGGLTWTVRQSIGASDTEYTYPVVGSDGTVYNFMMLNWGGGQIGTVQLTKSTNGGASWSAPTPVSTANQPPGTIPRTSVRFFAILSAAVDPNNSNLYVAWTDNQNSGAHGMDVVYVKSTNGGATWSSRTLLGNTLARECALCDNITPMLTVGADSKLHAFWLDRTFDPAHNLFDSWYSSSTDGGVTWDPDTRVSHFSQDLNVGLPPGSGGAAGDYWGLDTTQDVVYVGWNDTTYSGIDQDLYVAKGLMSSSGGSTPSPTVAPSNTPTQTSTSAPTNTPPSIVSATATSTAPPSLTPNPSESPTETATAQSTTQATETNTPSPSPTTLASCLTQQQFEDVNQSNVFYPQIQELACRGLINGYPCGSTGEPCVPPDNRPYFRTNNQVTRGQLSKIVAGAAGFNEPVSGQTFEDIPPGSTFYTYIERLAGRSIINGYPCGGVGEPCLPPENRPYFRPNASTTRGQISKIVSNAAGFTDPPGAQIFEDVPPGSTFYDFIQRLASRGVMQGYPCGAPGEPCVPPDNRPYFRPSFNATRGQTSKIVVNTFFP